MRVSYDPAKRAKTFAERGLDFADARFMRKANDREQARLAPLFEV